MCGDSTGLHLTAISLDTITKDQITGGRRNFIGGQKTEPRTRKSRPESPFPDFVGTVHIILSIRSSLYILLWWWSRTGIRTGIFCLHRVAGSTRCPLPRSGISPVPQKSRNEATHPPLSRRYQVVTLPPHGSMVTHPFCQQAHLISLSR